MVLHKYIVIGGVFGSYTDYSARSEGGVYQSREDHHNHDYFGGVRILGKYPFWPFRRYIEPVPPN